ncbi:hypothetical protein CDAR_275581 [Caerostris darwini]|uniref:Uncharacterized protein n=1 Tax=Caerostris darwini TaxID=1538125 RepID=A0AAV4UMU1_9ARAC|nr:hypothetical protein CDAR_275581 [Caerostris darwini]
MLVRLQRGTEGKVDSLSSTESRISRSRSFHVNSNMPERTIPFLRSDKFYKARNGRALLQYRCKTHVDVGVEFGPNRATDRRIRS